MQGVIAAFAELDSTVHAIEDLRKQNFTDITVYSPTPRHELEEALDSPKSPVRRFTLIGGLLGVTFGYWVAIWISDYWPIVVGGKPIASWVPYTIIGFELMVLVGIAVHGVRHVRRVASAAADDDRRLRRAIQSWRLRRLGSNGSRPRRPGDGAAAQARRGGGARMSADALVRVRRLSSLALASDGAWRLLLVHRLQGAAASSIPGNRPATRSRSAATRRTPCRCTARRARLRRLARRAARDHRLDGRQSRIRSPPTQRSLTNGRKYYSINCAVCHGDAGRATVPRREGRIPAIAIVGPASRDEGAHRRLHLGHDAQRTRPDADRTTASRRWTAGTS